METRIVQTNSQLPSFSLVSADKLAHAIQEFGEEYNRLVLCQYYKPVGIEKAVAANAPTFHTVTEFFGEKATKFWLRLHIAETFAFLGIYDTASKYQVQQAAELILSHEIFGQLTLSEFLCFLQRFKQGRYGKIYNSNRPNPQEFLMCLQPFWNELCQERGKLAEKERIEQISKSRHDTSNMSYQEWLEYKRNIGETPNNESNPLESWKK